MKVFESIVIVGRGNVSYHLVKAFGNRVKAMIVKETNFIEDWYSHLPQLTSYNELDFLPDLVLICVNDTAIHEVIEKTPFDVPVAYTSGSVKLSDLPNRLKLGVFYPLQTFSKNVATDISKVPFLIESENVDFAVELKELAAQISSNVLFANSQDRFHLHVAAVMVNNFTNHLYARAFDFLKEKELDFDLLLPLIEETSSKLNRMNPMDAQTGPTIRGDEKIESKHLEVLNGYSKEIYELMAASIKSLHEKNEL